MERDNPFDDVSDEHSPSCFARRSARACGRFRQPDDARRHARAGAGGPHRAARS